MKYKIEFEHSEIKNCEHCPFQSYESSPKAMWCDLQDESVSASFVNEKWWQDGIAELMLKCPLKEVKDV